MMTETANNSELHGSWRSSRTPTHYSKRRRRPMPLVIVASTRFTPFPVHGLAEAVGYRKRILPWLVLAGGLLGGLAGFALQYWVSTVELPMNVGGRPLNSWPSFIPVTFECTILGASLTAVLGMLALNGLPRPNHPVFNVARFGRASTNGFFLLVDSADAQFDLGTTRAFLEALDPRR